ncbi:MAG: sel1 repeat family protein [Rhodospirillales bacterium]|nr:sel1 repeat family protein [Rhodospirillales bacterium]
MKRLLVLPIVFFTLVATNVRAGTKEAAAEDYTARVGELTPLADGGSALAQLQMGLILRSGLGGIPKDPERAFGYLLKAAEQDQWNAQYVVAGMYAEGWGVPKNQVSALRWASIAAGRGSEAGLSIAEVLRSALDQTSRQKAQSMADQWSQATLIDGRPTEEYNVKCVALQVQIDEAKDFMNEVKTEAEAKELISATGAIRWSSLGMIYPSGTVALSDVARRYRGLLDIKSSKKCL